MEICVAREHDLAALSELIQSFRDHLGATRPTDEQLARVLPAVLADAATEFGIVRADDGSALGYTQCRYYTSVWASGTEAHLEDVFVVESARGQGLGTALIAFVLERAAKRGVRSIGLHTNEHNEQAQALYRQLGFQPQTEARWQAGREVYWVRAVEGA